MATLNTLLVNGDSVNGTRNWATNQDYLNIDEAIGSADGSAIIDNTNATTTRVSSYLLSSTNANFGNMISLSWQIRRRVSGAQTDVRILGVRIVTEAAGVVLAALNSGGAFQIVGTITNTTFANGSVTAFTYVNTSATKAQWDDARIEFQNDVTKVHGGDSNGMEIDTVEITGTYQDVVSPIAGVISGAATVTGVLTEKPGKIFGSTSPFQLSHLTHDSGLSFNFEGDKAGQSFIGLATEIFSIDFLVSGSNWTTFEPIFAQIWSMTDPDTPNALLETSINSIDLQTINDDTSWNWYRWLFSGTFYNQNIVIVLTRAFTAAPDGSILNLRQGPGSVDSGKRFHYDDSLSNWTELFTIDCVFRLNESFGATTIGTLTGRGALAGVINGVATVDGDLIAAVDPIEGIINGVATVEGVLSGKGLMTSSGESIIRQVANTGSFITLDTSTIRGGNRITEVFSGVIKRIEVRLRASSGGSPDGVLNMQIWSLDGANIPLAVLETSTNSINQNTLGNSGVFELHSFDFTSQSYNEKIAIEVNQSTVTTVDSVQVQQTGADIFPNENQNFYNGSWGNNATFDLTYTIYNNQGSQSGKATVTGALTIANSQISGLSNGVATVTGALTAKGALTGTINGLATTDGNLTTVGGASQISGVIDGVATTAGILTALGILQGAINAAATVDGIASARGDLLGEINGIATVQGTLSAKGSLAGAINVVPIISGILTGKGELASVINAIATIQGILTGKGELSGSSNGIATVQGDLYSPGALAGIINGVATVNGILTGKGALAGVSEPIPDNVDLAQGTLIAKFFTDDESYGETIDPKGRGVEYIDFYMGKIAAPDFEMRGEIWSMSGGLPDTLLQISNNTIEATTVPTGPTYQRFTFDVIQNFNQEIAIVVHIINHTVGNESNYIERYYGDSNHFKKGQIVYNFTGAAWSTEPEQDINGVIQLKKFTQIVGTSYGIANGNATVLGSLTAKGSLSGTVNGQATVLGILNSKLFGVSNGVATVSGTLTAKGDLQGAINALATVQGLLIGQALLQGTSNGVSTVSGTLTAIGQLQGIINGLAVVQGVMVNDDLAGIINGQATVSGTLTAKGSLEGIINAAAIVQGLLNAKGSLEGIVNAAATVQGILNALGSLEGQSNGIATVQGTLIGKGALAGIISGQAIVDGILTNDQLAGIISGQATTQGILTAIGSLLGTINGIATVDGILTSDQLSGIINGAATVSGTLTGKGNLAGTVNGLATVEGVMINNLAGVINALAIITATLTGKGNLAGTINGSALVEGILLDAAATLLASILGSATVTGTLTGKGALVGESNPIVEVTGDLTQSEALAGIINAFATVTGTLTGGGGTLKGEANGYSEVLGILKAKGKLEGVINAIATLQGVLNGDSMYGIAYGVATVIGSLGYKIDMYGEVYGVATVTGTLTDKKDVIYGVSNGSALVIGTLTAKGNLAGVINGRAFLAGIMGDNPEPKDCSYTITYNKNPKFVVIHNENEKIIVTYNKNSKIIITFNCKEEIS